MRPSLLFASAAFLFLAFAPSSASAYPQFQLTEAQTCASCHYSPSGGGLLSEMGRMTAEELTGDDEANGEFMYGKVPLPDWLELGGDLRAAVGVNGRGGYEKPVDPLLIPMQVDFYARAGKDAFSINLTGGLRGVSIRPSIEGSDAELSPVSFLVSREHFVMWKPEEGGEGPYVRAGKFMPVFGLRLAEHTAYTRRYGQTPLYGEAYGVGGGWLSSGLEVHATAFVHDPWRSTELGDGGAVYAEKRLFDGKMAAGAEARYANSGIEARTTGGVTGKYWLDGPGVLFQAELQATHQSIDAGGNRNELVGYLMTSWFFKQAWLLDVGLGYYDENLEVPEIDREAFDLGLHWFPWAHWEFALNTRVQTIGLGSGGETSGYGLLQAHYRL